MGVLIGVAVGHRRHASAIAVVEEEVRRGPDRTSTEHYLVRFLERLPPGTTYPALASRLAEILDLLAERGSKWLEVFVDATGAGEPLVELIEDAVDRCRVVAVYFSHGDQRSEEGRTIRLGKAYLVSRLKILLETDQLHLTRTPEAASLAEDLLAYEVEVTEDANERYGAFRVGRHDDLITALGLAVHKRRPMYLIPKY